MHFSKQAFTPSASGGIVKQVKGLQPPREAKGTQRDIAQLLQKRLARRMGPPPPPPKYRWTRHHDLRAVRVPRPTTGSPSGAVAPRKAKVDNSRPSRRTALAKRRKQTCRASETATPSSRHGERHLGQGPEYRCSSLALVLRSPRPDSCMGSST